MPDYQLIPVEHDPFRFSFTPVEHDPFADVMPPQRQSGTQQWQSAIEEPRQREQWDALKPSTGEQIGTGIQHYIHGGVPEVLQQQFGMQLPDWVNASNEFLHRDDVNMALGMAAPLKGAGIAGAAERGTVGALGGKPSIRTTVPTSGGEPERILGAAITTPEGKVFYARTHSAALARAGDHFGKDAYDLLDQGKITGFDGFVTSHGRLVSREEASRIAESSGQPGEGNYGERLRGEQLHDISGPLEPQDLEALGATAGTAGAVERGTVGALGGKPGVIQAARKAMPMAREATETATYAAPAGLRSQMHNLALTGKNPYKEGSETAGELFAKQMAWMRGEIGGPFPETLAEVAPRGKIDVLPSGVKYIPVDHDPFKK